MITRPQQTAGMGRLILLFMLPMVVGFCALGADASLAIPARWGGDDPEPTNPESASQLKNPVAYTDASVARGKAIYLRHCQECHDRDGRALANTMYEAADLTAPASWIYGTTDGEIFRSIREGAGDDMPPYKDTLKKEEEIWHLVNFLRSLGPQSMRQEGSTNPADE